VLVLLHGAQRTSRGKIGHGTGGHSLPPQCLTPGPRPTQSGSPVRWTGVRVAYASLLDEFKVYRTPLVIVRDGVCHTWTRPDPLMFGIRSPDGLVVGLAPAALENWV
jgi:hypothetical protein